MSTYVFYNDPGHAWLKVPRSELLASGVASKISTYSYQKGDYVYLEEDCDAGCFLSTLQTPPIIKDSYTDNRSRIRNYDSFRLAEGEG